ncbi:MAG: PAS domain-containing protein, partial [Rhodospirillales bacterium]|nr:PAS domain-containing protein [Acetobacter sp.]
GISLVLDISERKKTEAQLHQAQLQLERSDSQLQTIMDAVPTLIAYVDPRLRYIRVNRAYADFFGTEPEKVVGRPMQEVLQANFAQVQVALGRALGGEPQQVELSFLTRGTERRDTVAQYIPDLSPEGHLLGLVIQAADVTERRRTEHVLRTTEKLAAVGRLAASMAHEINNPLEAVTNLLFLARASEDATATQAFLEQAEVELRRVAAITNQTLRFHKQSTRPVAVHAEDLIHSVLGMYAARLLNGSVALVQRLRAPAPVQCFEGEIRQVLSNLVSNALDAMTGRDAVLTLRAAAATDWPTGRVGVRITVADTGIGMSRETLARVWEPFFTTKEASGTGLGLWISLDIAERHGAKLRVRSRVGEGTAVSLWLPLHAASR